MEAATFQGDQSDGTNMNTTQDTSYWVKGLSHSQQGVNVKVNKVSRLTTLGQAVGNDEGFEVKVIDKEQEVGDGESEKAEGKKLEGDELWGLQWWG